MTGLLRRPRIVAEWGPVQEDPYPYFEGISIIVTARRRPIEVDEVGLVFLPSTRRRQIPEWLREDRPFRLKLSSCGLPKRLQDGESIRAFGELDSLIDDAHGEPGTVNRTAYTYVKASGAVYLARDSKLATLLRLRAGEK